VVKIYQVNQAVLDNEPCGCPECSHRVQLGHFQCEAVSEEMLELEESGRIIRVYDDGRWRWVAC
jgi:hypothetical protein